MEWIYQDQDSTCWVIAALNAHKYLTGENLYKEKYEELVDLGKCRTGNIIDRKAVIKSLGLPMKPVCNIDGVLRNGGILSIMHPHFNLHAVFCKPTVDGYVLLINSWLGPVEMRISQYVISRWYLPKNPDNRDFWQIQPALESKKESVKCPNIQ